jgi:ribosomal protein S18 acetylase RimI-like enzyme
MIVKRKRDYLNNLFPEILDLGDNFSLRKDKPTKITQFLAKYFKRIRKRLTESNEVIYDVYYKEVEVGIIVFWENDKDSDEAYVNWISVKDKFEGHKIAQRVLRKVLEFLKNLGYKKVTLEVPGNSPNARHIYEKLGFKKVKYLGDDPMWGGLTSMELDLENYESKKI